MKAFETWTYSGLRFLAFPGGAGVLVMDEMGRNYGGWMTVSSFRERQTAKDPLVQPFPSFVELHGHMRDSSTACIR